MFGEEVPRRRQRPESRGCTRCEGCTRGWYFCCPALPYCASTVARAPACAQWYLLCFTQHPDLHGAFIVRHVHLKLPTCYRYSSPNMHLVRASAGWRIPRGQYMREGGMRGIGPARASSHTRYEMIVSRNFSTRVVVCYPYVTAEYPIFLVLSHPDVVSGLSISVAIMNHL